MFYIVDHMGTVGVLELDVLLCVARHDGAAYGLLVRAEVSEARAHDYSVGAIYTTLARLERKGLVAGRATQPIPVRGGRSRREYALTTAGREMLRAERERAVRHWGTDLGWGPA